MFNSLKGKFQQVQDGISASIRGLKIKDEKSNTSSAPEVNYYAGADIVLQNEETWKEIRSQSEKNIQKAELVDKKVLVVIPYLEHVINFWNDTNPLLHNALIHQYREKVLQLCDPSSSSADQVAGQNVRSKLINFLETSDYYVPETVLTHFPFDSLYEERAVLLGKFGGHEKSLTIYVTVLNDIEKAAHYCERVYNEGKPGSENVYIILLQLLINPPENWLVGVTPPVPPKPDIEMALTLLEGNATKIPPAKVLQILPEDVPVHKINHYLNISLGQHLMDKRSKQILRGLLYAEHLQVQEQRIQFESQNMLLTEWNICSVCKKKFSNQSAFIRNPNGDLIHFSCQDTGKGQR